MSSLIEVAIATAFEVILFAVVGALLYRIWSWFFPVPKRRVVEAFQRGVVLKAGRVEKIVSSGAHWITPKQSLVICDVRPTPFQVSGQELLAADGVLVRVVAAGEYRVGDPGRFVTASSDAFGSFYLELRQALRVAVGEVSSRDLVTMRAEPAARVRELLQPREAQFGVELTHFEIFEAVPIGRPHDG